MEAPPWIYELACYVPENGENKLRKFYQGYAETREQAISIGETTLGIGHPDPQIVAGWIADKRVPDDYASPWSRVVVFWAQFRPEDYYQDISDTEPVADLVRT